MRRLALVIVAAALAGCAASGARLDEAAPERSIRWVQLDEHNLQHVCATRGDSTRRISPSRFTLGGLASSAADSPPPSVNACYDNIASTCVIYTRRLTGDSTIAPRFQQTMGHEVLHCFLGLYH